MALIFMCATFACALHYTPYTAYAAEEPKITCRNANDLSEDYFSAYRLPTDMFTYEANGGGAIANAFDNNWNSCWTSGKDNGATFVNEVTVNFNRAVTIGGIAYAASTERAAYGYPQTLTVLTANGGDFSVYGTCASTPTNNRVLFEFAENITITQLKFRYTQPNRSHKWIASAREIVFLQPESESANKILGMFTDYTQHTVVEECIPNLAAMREDVKNLINYETALKPLLDRADEVVNGNAVKDERFEFSTDPDAKNSLLRMGNLISYAKDVLKVNVYGYTTNRQVTGICGVTGTKVTVYVDAPNPKDPLPSIFFSQASGYWQNWKATYSLSRGKNVFTVPQFLVEPNGAPGGPIYLVNPYTEAQQSADVRVYIEGGTLFPMFRDGDDEEAFKAFLKEYEEKRLTDTAHIVDVCEIVGNNYINTSKSSYAYNHYINGTVSPQANTDSWNKYITGLLAFDGITMDPEGEHFDVRNLHMPVNFRLAHWSGYGAYAVSEHIGLVALGHGSLTSLVAPGWGLSHEFGHMIDLGERSRAETTNNMFAVYGDLLMNNSMNTGKAQHIVAPAALYPDETAVSYDYFHKNGYSISQWWNLEAAYPGFWGRLDNNYRYYDRKGAYAKAGLTAEEQTAFQNNMTEKMVYFSSIATGVDLGYYYERYGFSFSGPAFKVANASAGYKKLVETAINDGVLSTKQYKYWYFDINQYFHKVGERALYDLSSETSIREIWKNGGQYTLVMSSPVDETRHLGYEIKEYRDGNWYVIGFTRTESFTDTTAYPEGYTPRYKIAAYDRQLNVSAESEEKSYEPLAQVNVCRIGETYYTSLAEAVEAASAGATVYLCADTQEGGIVISKSLSILPDPAVTRDITIKRGAANAIITLNGGVLNIGGTGAKIVFDGISFKQASPLINVGGATLNLNNVVLKNNVSTGNGGAVTVNTGSGKLNATGCEFTGNTASNGGAVYNVGTTTLNKCVISSNRATTDGGAAANYSGGVFRMTDCVSEGNSATRNGGGIAIDGNTAIVGTAFSGNKAGNAGGAIYLSISTNEKARYLTFDGGSLTGNEAKYGNIFYLQGGTAYLNGANGVNMQGEIYKNKGALKLRTANMSFANVIFYLPSIGENTVLFTADGNVTFTDELLATVKVYLGSASLDEGKKNVVVNNAATQITLKVDEQSVSLKHTVGWQYALPETVEGLEIPEGKKLAYWEIDGVKYKPGDSLFISDVSEISAVLEDLPIDTPNGNEGGNQGDNQGENGNNETPGADGNQGGSGTDKNEPVADKPEKSGVNVGMIVGIVVGVVAVAAAAVVTVLILKKKKSKKDPLDK